MLGLWWAFKPSSSPALYAPTLTCIIATNMTTEGSQNYNGRVHFVKILHLSQFILLSDGPIRIKSLLKNMPVLVQMYLL